MSMEPADSGREAMPPALPGLRQVTGHIADWHNGLRPSLRIVVTVLLFALMTAFYSVLLVDSRDLGEFLIYIAFLSPLVMLAVFVARRFSGRLINEIAGALLFSAIVPSALTSIFHSISDFSLAEDTVGKLHSAAIILALIVAGACIYRLASGRKDDGEALFETLPVLAGIACVILVFRLLDPGSNPLKTIPVFIGGLTVLTAMVTYYWRRRDVAAFLIWPLAAFAVCTAIENSGIDFAGSGDANRLLYQATPYALYGLLPGIIWWAFQLFIHRKAGRLDQSDRVGISIKALYRHWERSELVGNGAVEQLPGRANQLFNDIAYAALSAAVFYGIFSAAVADPAALNKTVSMWIFLPFLSVFIAIGYQAVFSLLMRLFKARRLRFSAMALAAVLSLLPTVATAYVIWNFVEMPRDDDPYIWITVQCAIWLVSLHVIMRAVRGINYTAERVRFGAMTIAGFLVSYPVFHYFLGQEAYARFDVGMAIGDAGWLMAFVLLVPVYAYHFREKSAFLVWLFGSAAGGLLLRAMVSVEAQLDDISEHIVVNADMNEVVLAAVFGAAAGSLGLLAKHIWYDKDQTKRVRAVRVRGLFTILHAVSPLVALLLFLMVAGSFRDNANVIIADAAGNFTQLTSSVVKIKDRAEKGAKRLKKQADKLVKEVTEAIPEEAVQLAADLQFRAGALVDQTTEAAKRTATVALDKAKATASEVGDKLSEALTPEIDFGFLGKLKMPDLGIGKFFRDLVGGMLPDLNLEELFTQAMTSLYADVEKQFEEPLRTATAMKDSVQNFVGRHQKKLEKIKDKALAEAESMVADIVLEKENTIRHINALVINAVTFFYQMLLFLILATGTIMGYLAWKVINGMVFMIARVRNGWTMLRHAVDVQYEKQIL